ncbi:MAG TPA: hypothetical protein VGO93_19155 [Candidatus Xenobia bacterium]
MSRDAWGTTLVEFIVAVGLLAMVFVFMFQLLPYSHVASHQSWDLSVARDLVHSEMEAARSYDIDMLYQAPSSGATTDPNTHVTYAWHMWAAPYPTPVPAGGQLDVQVVTVQVNWADTGFSAAGVSAVPRQMTSQTLVARMLPSARVSATGSPCP